MLVQKVAGIFNGEIQIRLQLPDQSQQQWRIGVASDKRFQSPRLVRGDEHPTESSAGVIEPAPANWPQLLATVKAEQIVGSGLMIEPTQQLGIKPAILPVEGEETRTQAARCEALGQVLHQRGFA